jgi:hypothetical protein
MHSATPSSTSFRSILAQNWAQPLTLSLLFSSVESFCMIKLRQK